jgi:hypothetical protein
MNTNMAPKQKVGCRNAVHSKAATPKTSTGVSSDTPRTLNKPATKRIDATVQMASGANRFSDFVMGCEATLMNFDFRADAEFSFLLLS